MLAANAAFYEAFEARDLDLMSGLWEHSDHVTCVHPGWSRLHGWGAVAASWLALFQGPQHLQFILTDARVEVRGDVAWVTVDENLLADEGSGTISALNVFVRAPGERWLVVAHHAGPVTTLAG